MTTESIIAICAIVLAKPLEIIWNKIFQSKITFKPKTRFIGHIILGYLLPIAAYFLFYFYVNFGKGFVILLCINTISIVITLILDLFEVHNKRLERVNAKIESLKREYYQP